MCGVESTLVTVIVVVGGACAFCIFLMLCCAAAVWLHDRKKLADLIRARGDA